YLRADVVAPQLAGHHLFARDGGDAAHDATSITSRGAQGRRRRQRGVAGERHVHIPCGLGPLGALDALLAKERRAEGRERDLELRIVRLDRRDLLNEEAGPQQGSQRAGREVPRGDPLELEREADDEGEKGELLE